MDIERTKEQLVYRQVIPDKYKSVYDEAVEETNRRPSLLAAGILALRTNLPYRRIGSFTGELSGSIGNARTFLHREFDVKPYTEDDSEILPFEALTLMETAGLDEEDVEMEDSQVTLSPSGIRKVLKKIS